MADKGPSSHGAGRITHGFLRRSQKVLEGSGPWPTVPRQTRKQPSPSWGSPLPFFLYLRAHSTCGVGKLGCDEGSASLPELVATQGEQGRGRASLGEEGPGVPWWGRGLVGV